MKGPVELLGSILDVGLNFAKKITLRIMYEAELWLTTSFTNQFVKKPM